MKSRPLEGVKVLEALSSECPLAVRMAVGLAGRILADLGAQVVKTEPHGGDPIRRLAPMVGADSALFAFLNAGKHSVFLPERSPMNMLPGLAAGCDAWLSDDSVLDLLQPALAASGARAPRVAVSVSLLGSRVSTPTPASEFTVLASSGILNLMGDPNREPLRLGGHQASYAAGLSAFAGLMGGLCGNEDEEIRVSLLETAIWLNWKNIASAATGGSSPSREGRASAWPIVRCADGWVALVYQERDWPALLRLLNDDPRLARFGLTTASGRAAHAAEIASVAEQHLGKLSRAEIHAHSLRLKLPLGPVWSPFELLQDPHLLARDFFHRCLLNERTEVITPRLPVRWNDESFKPGPIPLATVRSTPAANVAIP